MSLPCVAVYLRGTHRGERCGINKAAGALAGDAREERYRQRRRGGPEAWSGGLVPNYVSRPGDHVLQEGRQVKGEL